MARRFHPLRHIRLVCRRSSPLVKCVVLATIVLSTVALITLRSAIMDVQAKNQALKTQAAKLEEENRALEEDIQQVGSQDSVEKIAQEELGLVDPDSVFFVPEQTAAP